MLISFGLALLLMAIIPISTGQEFVCDDKSHRYSLIRGQYIEFKNNTNTDNGSVNVIMIDDTSRECTGQRVESKLYIL